MTYTENQSYNLSVEIDSWRLFHFIVEDITMKKY